jgi:hypothetical protein
MAVHIGLRMASVVTLLGVLALGCASPGMPPGGPPDTKTPRIVRITPDSNAVNVQAKSAFIFFDEVVSERPGMGGGSGGRAAPVGGAAGSALAALVSLSPSDGREDVLWRRTAIEISPRRGFRRNTAYRITLLPGVADLRGNSISVATEWVFSTGPSLPRGEVQGAVFDYAAGKVAPNAQVELFAPTDTVLRWTSRADSTGRFRVRDLTAGTYRVLAYVDANNDRRLSEREAYDTSTVTIDSLGTADLYAFVRDTVPPRIEQIELIDSTALRIRFDRPVAGDWKPEGAVALFDEDSVAIPLGGALMAENGPSLAAVRCTFEGNEARAAASGTSSKVRLGRGRRTRLRRGRCRRCRHRHRFRPANPQSRSQRRSPCPRRRHQRRRRRASCPCPGHRSRRPREAPPLRGTARSLPPVRSRVPQRSTRRPGQRA